MRTWLQMTAVGLLAVGTLTGCGSGAATGPTPTTRPSLTATPGTRPTPTTRPTPGQSPEVVGAVSAYFIRDERVAPVSRALPAFASPFETAVRAVIAGPAPQERSWDMTSSVPADSRLLGISTDGDVVTVNLSKEFAADGGSFSMAARLVQIVFAVTQFSEQERVLFQIEGNTVTAFGAEGIVLDHPIARNDFEGWMPAILVETPTAGATVGHPMLVAGTANTFEAVFHLSLVDASGRQLASRTVTATSGTGTRGRFNEQIPYSGRGDGALVVFEVSAKDGTRINEVRIPVTMTG